MATAPRKHLMLIILAIGCAAMAALLCFAGPLHPMQAPGSAKQAADEERLENAPVHVDIENMTRSLTVMVTEVQSQTVSDRAITHIKLAVRNDYLTGVVAFELVLPSGGRGRMSSLTDYFLSLDHPRGLQPEETTCRTVIIPASPSVVIRVSGLLLADGDSEGEPVAVSGLLAHREGQIVQAERAIALLSRWLSRADLNTQVTDNLLMMKDEIDQLEEESSSRQGAMYSSGLQYVKSALQIWMESILESSDEGHNPPDLAAIIHTELAAFQRAVSAD